VNVKCRHITSAIQESKKERLKERYEQYIDRKNQQKYQQPFSDVVLQSFKNAVHQVNNAVIEEPDMQCKYDTNQYINLEAKADVEEDFWVIKDKIKNKEKGDAQEMHLPMPDPFHYS
jgi:hypothetical protein